MKREYIELIGVGLSVVSGFALLLIDREAFNEFAMLLIGGGIGALVPLRVSKAATR
jgi:hypothetical protein